MQRRYPAEQIGASCFAVALMAAVHASRGELQLAIVQRQEAAAIMTDLQGPQQDWTRAHHY
jgi:hypothetical protein